MSVYRFGRFGSLWRDDHPLALYAGTRRLSPEPKLVGWWPLNWIAVAIVLPQALFNAARAAIRKHTNPNRS